MVVYSQTTKLTTKQPGSEKVGREMPDRWQKEGKDLLFGGTSDPGITRSVVRHAIH
jgi:hypothetical protein